MSAVSLVPADRYVLDLAPADTPLDALAAEIRASHGAAERAQFAALEHARMAGTQLLAAKARLPHGKFKPFVRDECQMPHSTANLYMKVARRWDELGKSQPVATLTLRAAAKLLCNGTLDDDTEATADALFALGVLGPDDLRALSEAEIIALVREVHAAYIQCVTDIDADGFAERIAHRGPDGPAYGIDRRGLATLAHRTAAAMRDGLCTPGQVRKYLGVIPADDRLRKALRGRESPTQADVASHRSPAAPRAPITVTPPPSVLDAFVADAHAFARTTQTLLTASHGLLQERLVLNDAERTRLLAAINEVRDAIAKMEAQARRSAMAVA